MSAKKKAFVEKGLVVAAFLAVAVVGIVVAQQNALPMPGTWQYDTPTGVLNGTPWHTGMNMMSGEPNTTASLTFGVEVENYAAIYAFSAHGDAAKLEDPTTRVNPATIPVPDVATPALGNVGFLMVETNIGGWDILVEAKNGGYLVRDPRDGVEDGDDPVGFTPQNIAEVDAFLATVNENTYFLEDHEEMRRYCLTEVPATNTGGPGIQPGSGTRCSQWQQTEATSPGIYLKQRSGATVAPVPVNVGIGTVWLGDAVENFNDLSAVIKDASIISEQARFESFVPLNLTANAGKASFAGSFSSAFRTGTVAVHSPITNMTNNNATGNMQTTAFATNLNDGTNNEFRTFPKIRTDYNANETDAWEQSSSFTGIGDPLDNSSNKTLHPAMLFYINAELNNIGTNELSGNRNGTYTETLEFTFWGVN